MAFDIHPAVSADDHLHVTDALLRFGAGVDDGDRDLLATAFSDNAVVDFGPCGLKMGLDFPPMTGGKTIVGFLAATAQPRRPVMSYPTPVFTSKAGRPSCALWSMQPITQRTITRDTAE